MLRVAPEFARCVTAAELRLCIRVLSSGFSWKTNQHGLTIDTIVGYELVMPNGTITSVTADSDPDLFWGLKVRNPSVNCLYSSESPD